MKMAIVGSGLSGLVSAYKLIQKGHSVTLYEKEKSLGGHIKTVKSGTNYVEMASYFFSSEAFSNFLEELEITYSSKYFNRRILNSKCEEVPQVDESEIEEFIAKFSKIPEVLSRYGLSTKNPIITEVHEDLTQSFSKWCESNDLKVMEPLLKVFFTCYGFGNIEDVPAIYPVSILCRDSFRKLVSGEKISFISNGSFRLIEKLESIISDIRYNDEVLEVIPQDDNTVDIVSANGKYTYDKVIIASKVKSGVIKSNTLNKIMEKYQSNLFITIGASINEKVDTTYLIENIGSYGKVLFYSFVEGNPNSIVIYLYSNGKISHDEIKREVENTGVTINHFFTTCYWNTFPHVKMSDINGFYEHLNNIQGYKNIYFTGPLVTISTIDTLYKASTQIIDKFIK